jgi:hypothetical protein
MPKLPHLPRRSPPHGEAARLSHWFRERDLALRLWKEMPEEYVKALHSPSISERARLRERADLVVPFDKDLQVGQIRILHGGMFAEMRRPMHIAILSEWPPSDSDSDNGKTQKNDRMLENPRNIIPIATRQPSSIETTLETIEEKSYLVAPFSDYQEPATTTEWLTGHDVGPLRVLCLWNTRDYPARWLELGWVVGEMKTQELADAWDVFRHAFTGIPLSDRLRAQVGAPIIHPRDPRLAYQAEEVRLFTIVPEYADYRWKIEQAKKSSSQSETFGRRGGIQVPPQPPRHFEKEELALAAASLTELAVSRFLVAEKNARIAVHYDRDDSRRWLVVWDSPSKQKPSSILDGYRVFVCTKENNKLHEVEVIKNCKAELPHDATELRLFSSDGKKINLEPIKS